MVHTQEMRADRLLRLLMLLQRHRRATAGWLAGELQVSERTVLRDMEALSAAGVPVYTERGRGGGCVLLDGFTTKATGLTTGETQALFAWAARDAVAELGQGPDLRSALAKIATTAPAAAVQRAESLGEVVLADRRRWFSAAEDVSCLPVLREAAATGRRLRVLYRSAHNEQPQPRVVDPIGVVDHSGRWYLVAEHGGIARTYRVSRMAVADLLDESVQLRDRRPLAVVWADLRGAFETSGHQVQVTLLVSDQVGELLRALLASQLVTGTGIESLEPASDGRRRWRMVFRHRSAALGMLTTYVDELIVQSPADLVAELCANAERVLARYPCRG